MVCRLVIMKLSYIRSSLMSLASSMSLSYLHNGGSFLGMALVMQVVSGLFLAVYYSASLGYESVMYIVNEVAYGWLFKTFHSNNAGLIFVLLYLHLYKNVKLASYRLRLVWYSGLIMWVLIMAAGFTGYVLVGSQMSFWAAMVITSLISVIPLCGETLMYFVWGGFNISWLTLQLLYLVHFMVPFLVLGIMILHLLFLHKTGSTNMIYMTGGVGKITFYPFYWVKDLVNLIWYLVFIIFVLLYPYALGEVELFEEANPLVSPVHVVPEFYFLAAYAVLRSVPSKGLGVLIMFASIGIYFIYPSTIGYVTPASGISHTGAWLELLTMQIALSYLGMSPISQPFVVLSLICVAWFFSVHMFLMSLNLLTGILFSYSEASASLNEAEVLPWWVVLLDTPYVGYPVSMLYSLGFWGVFYPLWVIFFVSIEFGPMELFGLIPGFFLKYGEKGSTYRWSVIIPLVIMLVLVLVWKMM